MWKKAGEISIDNNITPIQVNTSEMVCPYRTRTIAYQTKNEVTGIPEAHQIAEFPSCYYNRCPFYLNGECGKAALDLGKNLKYH